jgi:hypothetical protein
MDKTQLALGIVLGAGAILLARFGYLVAKKGWGWGLAKLKAWWNSAKNDLAAVEARVTALEVHVGLKKGAAPVAAAPAPAAASTTAPAA